VDYLEVPLAAAGRMQDKVVFITGVARGMGRNHALRLAEQGADIIGVDLCADVQSMPYPLATEADLALTRKLVQERGRRCIVGRADVRDVAQLRAVLDPAVAELGRLDAVIANAGIFAATSTLGMPESTWQETLDVNLTGTWNTCRAAVPHVLASGRGGSIILVSSMAALTGNANTANYTASKHGVVGLMRVLAAELGPHRVRVNTVNPTGVATPMVLNEANYRLFRPDLEAPTEADLRAVSGQLNKLPVGLIEPDDVSHAVIYLLSDEARYVTGVAFPIDAGLAI
jgi:(+)-trans-carveol dehydrogenase